MKKCTSVEASGEILVTSVVLGEREAGSAGLCLSNNVHGS